MTRRGEEAEKSELSCMHLYVVDVELRSKTLRDSRRSLLVTGFGIRNESPKDNCDVETLGPFPMHDLSLKAQARPADNYLCTFQDTRPPEYPLQSGMCNFHLDKVHCE